MLVMPGDNMGAEAKGLAAKYPGRIGSLLCRRWQTPIGSFGVDNRRYIAWATGKAWDESEYFKLLDRVSEHDVEPEWVLVPDLVGNAIGTLREWDKWRDRVAAYGWPLAIAVQDGMTPDCVPDNANVVFVGGTTRWKRETISRWCSSFPRVHVGRINTERWLWHCHKAGAESCDGTGWFRGDQFQLSGLKRYLRKSSEPGFQETDADVMYSATFFPYYELTEPEASDG